MTSGGDDGILEAAEKKGILTESQVRECRSAPAPLQHALDRGMLAPEDLDALKLMLSMAGVRSDPEPDFVPGFWDDVAGKSFGRYELLEKVGEGASAIVIKARDPALDRTVALKVLKESGIATRQAVARFQREARAIAALRHPHIITLHEVGQIYGWHYLATDYIAGPSFAWHIAARNLSRDDALEIMEKVARACHHAHARGIVHRDLKPENILLDERLHPYVSDFGLARFAGGEMSMTVTGTVMGTPNYMSPEHLSGKPDRIDARSDVFSLGVILYECLTGRLPFQGDSITAVYNAIETSEPPRPRALNADIDLNLEAVVVKAMERDSRRRYPTAEQLADDIANARGGRAVSASQVHTARIVLRRMKKHRLLLGVAGALLLLAAGALAAVSLGFQRERERTAALNEAVSRCAEAVNQFDMALLLPPTDLTPRAGTLDREIVALQGLAESDADSPRLHFELGRALVRRGRAIEAMRAYERAGALDPGYSEARFEHGKAAVEEYLARIRELPPNAVPEERRDFADRQKELLRTAADSFRSVTGDLSAWHLQFSEAYVLALTGRGDESEKKFSSLIRTLSPARDPRLYADTFFGFGSMYYFRDMFPEAIEKTERGLTVMRSSAPAHLLCGDAHMKIALAPGTPPDDADRQLQGAELHFADVMKIAPNNSSALCARGNVLTARMRVRDALTAEDYDRAIAAFDLAIRQSPELPLFVVNRADLVLLKLHFGLRAGGFDDAAADAALRDVHSILSRDARYSPARAVQVGILEQRLRHQAKRGEWNDETFARALRIVDEGCRLHPALDYLPRHAAVLCNLKLEVLSSQGRFDESLCARALEYAFRAKRLAPDNVQNAMEPASSYQMKLMASIHRGEFDEPMWETARRQLRDALRIGPRYTPALLNMGNLCITRLQHRFSNDVFEEGRDSLARALEIAPDHSSGWNSLGILHYLRFARQSEVDHPSGNEALAAFDRALKLFPKYPEAMNNRGNVFLTRVLLGLPSGVRAEDLAEANLAFRTTSEFNPNFFNAHLNRALVNERVALARHQRREDPAAALSEALDAFEKAMALSPDYPELRFRWCRMLVRSALRGNAADGARAEQALSEQIERAPRHAEAHLERGRLRHHLGRFQPALEDLQKAVEFSPGLSTEARPLIESCRKGEY
jgi:tetratricopeptide (TPR) repeat protein/tRNA A-37 threonylcarbamoyl transferase component Bud32